MPKKPDDKKIIMEPVERLIENKHNARTHSAEQVDQIAAAIKEFGFINPILVDEKGEVLAGHGRILAARQLGMKAVPALRFDHLTDEQKRAYLLADNKLAENAGWDEELLKLELWALEEAGFDVPLTGFSEKEIEALKKAAENEDPIYEKDEPISDDLKYQILVFCENEDQQTEIMQYMEEEGVKCKPMIL